MEHPTDTVRIKRIYEPKEADDGFRVLVDRVWPRGLTKERAALDLWLKDIAPTTALRQWFGHDPARWPEFRTRYLRELEENRPAVERLREIVARGPTTLLYGAQDEGHNQAVVILEALKARN